MQMEPLQSTVANRAASIRNRTRPQRQPPSWILVVAGRSVRVGSIARELAWCTAFGTEGACGASSQIVTAFKVTCRVWTSLFLCRVRYQGKTLRNWHHIHGRVHDHTLSRAPHLHWTDSVKMEFPAKGASMPYDRRDAPDGDDHRLGPLRAILGVLLLLGVWLRFNRT